MATHFHPFPRSPLHRPLPPFPRYLTFRHSLELVEMLRFRSRCYLFRAGRASKNPHRSRFSADSHPRENLSAGYRIPSPPSDPFEGPVIDYYSPTISHELLFRVPIRTKLLVDGFRTDSKSRAVSPREEDTLFPFILHSFGFHRCHGIPNCRTVSREKKDKVVVNDRDIFLSSEMVQPPKSAFLRRIVTIFRAIIGRLFDYSSCYV